MTTDLFSVVTIETLGTCNNTCFFCRYGQTRWIQEKRPIAKLPFSTFVKIIKNLQSLNYMGRLSLHGISEPLLDHRLTKLVKIAKKQLPNVHHAIISNGVLLNQDVTDRLFEAGLDHLTVTAYTDQTFDKCVQIHAKSMNVKDRRKSVGYKWENRGGNIVQLQGQTYEGDCKRPSTCLTINAEGKAVLCCADMYGDVIVGNVDKSTLEEIWFGKILTKYRKILASKKRSSLILCKDCDHDGRGHTKDGS